MSYIINTPSSFENSGPISVKFSDSLNLVNWDYTTLSSGEMRMGTSLNPKLLELSSTNNEVGLDALAMRSGINKVVLNVAPGLTSSYNYPFPNTAPVSGQVMQFNGTNNVFVNSSISISAGTGLTGGGTTSLGQNTTLSLSVPVIIAHGGTNSTTLLNNDRIIVSSLGKIVESGALTNGQILIGSTGSAPVVGNILGGSGISITNGAGTITVSNTSAILPAIIGNSPNNTGMTATGLTLNLEPASSAFGGVVTMLPQTLGAGNKTFTDDVIVGKNLILPDTTSANSGVMTIGDTRFHNYSPYGAKNIYLGETAGNFTGSATYNIGIGTEALKNVTSGNSDIVIGHGTSSITSGRANILMNAGWNITTGDFNVCLQGSTMYTNESGNLNLCSLGVAGENNTIRIGNDLGGHLPNHTKCYIAGISGNTSTSGIATYINASGLMGTATSSIRFKNTVIDVSDVKTSSLHNLGVKSFYYNDDVNKKNIQYGMIAEEVLLHYPELICYELDGITPQTIFYQFLPPLLLKELQVQKKRIDTLEARLTAAGL